MKGITIMTPSSVMIHTFEPSAAPYFDDEGDQMVGSYFQFVDAADVPIGAMVGPYRTDGQAAAAARLAFDRKDF